MANKPFSGKHHYDANQQGQFKPHPPSKLPLPPNRLAHGIRRADMKVGNQRRLSNGYQSSSDEQGDSSAFSRKHHSVGHFIRKQSEETEGQYSSSSRVSLPKYAGYTLALILVGFRCSSYLLELTSTETKFPMANPSLANRSSKRE